MMMPISYPMDLPKIPAIYIVCLPCGEVAYIGKASSLRYRWAFQTMAWPFHHIFPEAWASHCSLRWIDCTGTTDKERKSIERALISLHRPKWNRSGNKGFYAGKREPAEWAKRCDPARLVQAKNRNAIFREHPAIAARMQRALDKSFVDFAL